MMDWKIIAALVCFLVGLVILWYWQKPGHKPPDKYIFLAYVTYLVYIEKLKDTKWYQWRKRRQIDKWVKDEIKAATKRHEDEEDPPLMIF